MRRIFVATSIVLVCYSFGVAQSSVSTPLRWSFSAVALNDKEAKIIFTCALDEGWHIYSQFIEEGGPLPTTFTFVPDASYSLDGKVNEESTAVEEFDAVFQMPIVWYKNTAVFTQIVKLNAPVTIVKGKIAFMGCNTFMCLPPDEVSFSVEVRSATKNKKFKGE